MLDQNPYESPLGAADTHPHDDTRSRRDHAVPDEKLVAYAQLGLRLVGVLLGLEGLAGIVGSCIYVAVTNNSAQVIGVLEQRIDPYAVGWFASSVTLFLLGAYLMVSGRWIMEMVFLPAKPNDESEDVVTARDTEL